MEMYLNPPYEFLNGNIKLWQSFMKKVMWSYKLHL